MTRRATNIGAETKAPPKKPNEMNGTTDTITPETAPRSLAKLSKIGIFYLRKIIEPLGGLDTEEQRQAWAGMTLDRKIVFTKELLEQFDANAAGRGELVATPSGHDSEHITPHDLIARVNHVEGGIDLDPASSHLANTVVGAKHIFTLEDDGLTRPWFGRSVYVNPPGGTIRLGRTTMSTQSLWWEKLGDEWLKGHVESAIFMGFNLEIMRHSQSAPLSIFDFPFCVPAKRTCFLKEEGGVLVPQTEPTHANVIVFLPSKLEDCLRFEEAFSALGRVVLPTLEHWRRLSASRAPRPVKP